MYLTFQLPIPQLLANYQRKSLAGFRSTVLMGWIVGDSFKTGYFFLQPGNSLQFKVWYALLPSESKVQS